MIAITILSCLQIAALLYFAVAAIRINRLKTLAKNLDWVAQNQEFAKENGEPVYWPLITVGIVLYGIIIAGVLIGSMTFLLNGKYYVILIAASVLFGAYYLIDKQLSTKIPMRKERTASLIRRTLESYVRPSLILSAKTGALFVALAIIAAFFIHKITVATFLYDMLIEVFCYCAIWAAIHFGLEEKMPHENDIPLVTKINVGENYRRFSMNFLIGVLFFIIIFTLFLLGCQWFGFDIVRDPAKEALHRLLGEAIPACRPVFTLQQWDIIYSMMTSILCIVMVKSKPFRDILSIKIKPTQPI
jgi:hypothetical protein